VDRLDRARRSALMSRIRAKNTQPELTIRSALHRAGIRFRISARDLPGNPDLVNRRRRFAVFVHGCFWHAHANCRYAAVPKSRPEFWSAKFAANKKRDTAAIEALTQLGFRTAIVWECSLKHADQAALSQESLLSWIQSEAQHLEIESD
jgi:DNA mismatch endonuclease (patch repair protein)